MGFRPEDLLNHADSPEELIKLCKRQLAQERGWATHCLCGVEQRLTETSAGRFEPYCPACHSSTYTVVTKSTVTGALGLATLLAGPGYAASITEVTARGVTGTIRPA